MLWDYVKNQQTVLIPNCFDREDLEALLGMSISPELFRELAEYVEETLADRVSELVVETITDYLERDEQ